MSTPSTPSAPSSTSTSTSAPAASPAAQAAPSAPRAPNAVRPTPPGTPGAPAAPGKPPEGTPAPEAAPKPNRAGKTFAAAMAQEKKARGLEAQLSERQKALDAKEAQLKELEALRESDPLAYLEKQGLSYEKLTDAFLNGKPAAPAGALPADVKAKLDEVEAVKAKLEALEKTREEAQKALETERQRQQADRFFSEGEAAVRGDAARFATLLAYRPEEGAPDGLGLARAYVSAYAQKHGTVLPFTEAAAHVQETLDRIKRGLLHSSQESAKIPPGSPKASPAGASSGPAAAPPPRTLTHDTVGQPSPVNLSSLSMAQRQELAIEGLRRMRSQQS